MGKNQLVTISGKPFESIIWQMPDVKLTKDKAKDIDIRNFEEMQDRLGKLIQEGQKNLAMIEYMRKELLQARKKQDELEEKLNEKDQKVSGNTTSPVTDFVKNCY